MADPRHPDYDPANDPTRPVGPGPVDRDLTDPALRIDPYNDPRIASPSRGLTGATIAVAVVLLAVLAFAFLGGTSTDEASIAPGTVVEDPNNPATGAIEPGTAGVEPDQAPAAAPADPVAPAEPAAPAPTTEPAPVQ
jgi:hypothetical protein